MMHSIKKIRVVVVDDSVLMRTLLKSELQVDGDIEVVGLANDPFEGREAIKRTDPDLVTLDVEMPGMSGLEFLEKIMTLRPMPVVMVSSLTKSGAETTLEALNIGAVDFIAKPPSMTSSRAFGEQLRTKIRAARNARLQKRAPAAARATAQLPTAPSVKLTARSPALIAVGASTGGVTALRSLIGGLPRGLPPVTTVIHMPEQYTGRFAARLREETGHDVAEARAGEVLRRGMIRIAPGDQHLRIDKRGGDLITRLDDGPAVSGHRPSVDVCFESVAQSVGGRALGVILTGMGRDGAKGMLKMRQAGCVCLGESERTCVVYGMPKAARDLGAVTKEDDLDKLPNHICEFVRGQHVSA